MKIGIIGTGRMGKGLVGLFAPYANGLMWGSRTPELAERIRRERGWDGVVAADRETALEADVVIHALWFRDALPWVRANEARLAGKILIDVSNPFAEDFSTFTLDWGQSAAETLQEALPRTAVVGAFKNTFFPVLERPFHRGERSDVFVTADDERAKRIVLELLRPLPFRFLDAGKLANNRTIERMTLLARELSIRHGHYPYVAYRLFGMDDGGSEGDSWK